MGLACDPSKLRVEECDQPPSESLGLKTNKTQPYEVGQLRLEGRSRCLWRGRLLAVSALLFLRSFS